MVTRYMKATNFIRYFGYVVVLIVLNASCGSKGTNVPEVPNPKANFSYNADTDNNLIINFTNQSENYASLSWDFGDNKGKSSDKKPTYTYASEGTYAVTLTATNSRGVTDTRKMDVIVKPNNPRADFSFGRDEANAMKVLFTNQSQYYTSVSWDFGDNSGTSSTVSPSYTYTTQGTYTVTLTAKNSAGVTSSKTMRITVPITNVSGQPVPIGDIGTEWKQIFYDDFTKDAAVGSWDSPTNNPGEIVYTGAQGQQWKTYPKTWVDTYQKRNYRPDKVLSVKDGALYFHLHTVDGQPAGANPSPVINNGSQYQTYGRYTARFKVDKSDLHEYYVAWLMWPQTEKWPDDGEEDFPEGGLTGNIGGYHHYAGEDAQGPCRPNCQQGVSTNKKFTEWHTYTVEWRPGNIKYILDGEVILNSSKGVPDKPMRWQLQTETKGNATGASGNLILDWVAVYKYQP